MADAHKNFATSLVATAPSPAASGTSLVVTAADGAKFPTAPFNATIWPAGVQPTTANAEIVRVTAISTDTFTIVRAQEGSVARTVVIGDQISANITAKTLTDTENPLTGVTGGTLAASVDSIGIDTLEISATDTLELPATSTVEVVPSVKQAEVQSYFGIYDFIESGCVWSADSAGSTLNGTMTDGYVWINGRRLRVNGVRSRGFTASRDTYVDFSDNGDGTAKITYTENTNNLSTGAPALPVGYLRNAIIVTAAGSIAAATSINQGQESMLVPIVSTVPYAVTDSIGNLICPRDPARKLIGYRQNLSSFTTTNTAQQQVTQLSVPVIVPLGRKIKISAYADSFGNSAASTNVAVLKIWDGVVGSGTAITQTNSGSGNATAGVNGFNTPGYSEIVLTPTTSNKTYNLGININVSGTAVWGTNGISPVTLKVELE